MTSDEVTKILHDERFENMWKELHDEAVRLYGPEISVELQEKPAVVTMSTPKAGVVVRAEGSYREYAVSSAREELRRQTHLANAVVPMTVGVLIERLRKLPADAVVELYATEGSFGSRVAGLCQNITVSQAGPTRQVVTLITSDG